MRDATAVPLRRSSRPRGIILEEPKQPIPLLRSCTSLSKYGCDSEILLRNRQYTKETYVRQSVLEVKYTVLMY